VQTAAFAFFALAQALLAVIAIRLYRRQPSLSALMTILPIAGVVWDNAIVALGATIGPGPLLIALSWPRFIGHALLTPAWILAGIGFAQRSGAGWLRSRSALLGGWILYAIAVIAGLLRYGVYLRMAPVWDGGLFYYTNAGTFPGPPFGSILMLVVVLICSFIVWRRARIPWLLIGSVFMLLTQLVPRELVGFLVTNSGEVVMAATLVATEAILQNRRRARTDVVVSQPAREYAQVVR